MTALLAASFLFGVLPECPILFQPVLIERTIQYVPCSRIGLVAQGRVMRRVPLLVLGAAALAHGLLLANAPLIWQTLAVWVLGGVLPGALLVEEWVGRCAAPPSLWERILYSIAAGYGSLIVVLLLLSYLPGPLVVWQSYVAFDVLLLALLGLFVLRQTHGRAPRGVRGATQSDSDLVVQTERGPLTPWPESGPFSAGDRNWLALGLLLLLLVGGFFRLANLGYAEYHGDEARAVLRAAAVIQGYDDVLFLHKKGPAEILLPAAIDAMAGRLTEAAARLPFALANLTALFGVFLLGWRMRGWGAGWSAAMLLALDGYAIAFARIVQYQSIVILTSVLVILILLRLVQRPQALTRYLTLAAFLMATGLLSHYEGGLVAIPATFLGGLLLWRERARWRVVAKALAISAVTGAGVLALFYVPFVLNSQFGATYTYLMDRRIGSDSLIANNLADFFIRTTLYSTSYYTLLLIALAATALILIYRRNWGTVWGSVAGGLLVAGLAMTGWNTQWLVVGATDLIFLFFLLALLPAWFLPKVDVAERILWLWFGAPLLLLLFFVAKPRTHVYVFFVPWVLIAGLMLERGRRSLKQHMGGRVVQVAGGATAALLILIFGIYAYWYFVYNRIEILRTWDQNRPAGYWTAYATPDNHALFGFPLANGWKVVGMLYQQGKIAGDYATNEVEFWTPVWYTRGRLRCDERATWFFRISNPQPDPAAYDRTLDAYLAKDFRPWGAVEINGAPRMVIYKRSQTPFQLQTFKLDDYANGFDALATPDLPLGYPVVEPPITHPLHVNLGNQIWLEGYALDPATAYRPGQTFNLTLYWRAQQPIEKSYKVFNQAYYGNGVMVAQQDGYPVCGARGTWLWDPGELIADVHTITVKPGAPPGIYPLYTGLYIQETQDRLNVVDAAGQPAGDQVHLTDIQIGK